MLAVIEDLTSAEMFASYGSDVKPLALSPLSFLISWKEDYKTVRIFAYSSKHEQSNKRSGTNWGETPYGRLRLARFA